MLLDEKINTLQNLIKRKISYEELALILGVGTANALRNWNYRKRHLKDFEIKKIDEAFAEEIAEKSQSKELSNFAKAMLTSHNPYKTYEDLPLNVKEFLYKKYLEGINLNWLVSGEGNKFNPPQFEQVKDDLAQRMDKFEKALRSAGILKD